MHTTIKTRGIYTVRASNDRWLGGAPPPAAATLTADPSNPRAALAELQAAWSDFRKEDKSRYTELQAQIADIATRNAALEINGRGGADGVNFAALRGEREQITAHIRAGTPMAMQVGSDPDGGYGVAPVTSGQITKKLFDASPMRRLSRSVTITTGDAFEEMTDFSDASVAWVGELESRPQTDGAQFGMFRVPVREQYGLVPLSQRLIDDASFDIAAYVEDKMADKMGRVESATFVTGDGVLKPRGFLDYPTSTVGDDTRARGTLQHVVSGDAGKITADALRDLVWSLRAPYRKGASWLMSSNTANAIDKLKDQNGDYLWRDGMTAGAQPSLLGYPVEFDENMPAVAANAFPIAFGNFGRSYIVVDKVGVRFIRDNLTSRPNILLYGYRRVGGDVYNFEPLKLLKIAAS